MAENHKTIGDRYYSFGNIPALEAVRLQTIIARSLGGPLLKAAGASGGKLSDEDKEALASSAIAALASSLNEDDTVRVVEMALARVTVRETGKQDARVNIDTHFTGRSKEMWQVVFGSLLYNFADFFPERLLASLGARFQELTS